MTAFAFHNPVRVEFGVGALAALERFAGGRRALFLAHRHAAESGLLARAVELSGAQCAGSRIVAEMPDTRSLASLYAEVWSERFDLLVAIGGGSVIDTAKVLSVRAADPPSFSAVESCWRSRPSRDGREPPHAIVPVIAVPTTASSGSEVTPWATVWDHERAQKHSLHLADLWPLAAICDPSLTVSAPPGLTVSAGLDALAHALEAIWNVHPNPISTRLATSAAHGILRHLPAVHDRPRDLDARTAMMCAALEAGFAVSNTKTGLAHALSYALTLRKGVPHGRACALFLPHVADAIAADGGPVAEILGEIFGPRPGDGARRFLSSVGVSPRLGDHGLGPADAAPLVETARSSERGRNSTVDAERVLRAVSMELGAGGSLE